MKRYRFSESFLSIQGEGHYIGVPSVFLRFWGCNFTCAGFSNPERKALGFNPADIDSLDDLPVIKQGCDTVYAWSREFRHLSRQATASELCDIIEGLCPSFRHPRSLQSTHFVLTGGETMLSQTAIAEVMATFEQRSNLPANVTVETNGKEMRAWDFISEAGRSPIISLRHINKLKKIKLARQEKDAHHQALISVMYVNPALEIEQMELEKARTELAQEKAELAATKAEEISANKDVLAHMAASGIQMRHDNQEKIEAMASNGIGRRKKP